MLHRVSADFGDEVEPPVLHAKLLIRGGCDAECAGNHVDLKGNSGHVAVQNNDRGVGQDALQFDVR